MNVTAIFQQISALYQTNCVSSVVALAREEMINRNLHAYTFNFSGMGQPVGAGLVLPTNNRPLPAIICHLGRSRALGIPFEVLMGKFAEIASWGYVVLVWQPSSVIAEENDEDNVLETGRVLISTVLKRLPFVDVNHVSLIDEDRGGIMTYRPFSCLGLTSQAEAITNLVDLKRVLEHSTNTKQENRTESSPRNDDHQLQPAPVPSMSAKPLQLFGQSLYPVHQPLP